jgi:RimJ/RimL family protein N-acetyltransferase
MEEVLQTERLRIRRFNTHDALFVMQLTNTEDWLRNIGDRSTGTEELAQQCLEIGNIKSYQDRGYDRYLVELKETGEPIGMCGFFRLNTAPGEGRTQVPGQGRISRR